MGRKCTDVLCSTDSSVVNKKPPPSIPPSTLQTCSTITSPALPVSTNKCVNKQDSLRWACSRVTVVSISVERSAWGGAMKPIWKKGVGFVASCFTFSWSNGTWALSDRDYHPSPAVPFHTGPHTSTPPTINFTAINHPIPFSSLPSPRDRAAERANVCSDVSGLSSRLYPYHPNNRVTWLRLQRVLACSLHFTRGSARRVHGNCPDIGNVSKYDSSWFIWFHLLNAPIIHRWIPNHLRPLPEQTTKKAVFQKVENLILYWIQWNCMALNQPRCFQDDIGQTLLSPMNFQQQSSLIMNDLQSKMTDGDIMSVMPQTLYLPAVFDISYSTTWFFTLINRMNEDWDMSPVGGEMQLMGMTHDSVRCVKIAKLMNRLWIISRQRHPFDALEFINMTCSITGPIWSDVAWGGPRLTSPGEPMDPGQLTLVWLMVWRWYY